MPILAHHSLLQLWKVLVVFLLPFGGGIPAGVLLARSYGMGWPLMTILYFISDVVLALFFEPFIILFVMASKKITFLARLKEAFSIMIIRTKEHYGNITGPFALIIIAFGVDPMTGRAIAAEAGHGFISGWMIAIAGDMLFFAVVMISTLWLHNIIGDGVTTTLIIFAAMMIIPVLIKRFRERNS